jgi:hypothetical protein
MHSEPKAKDGEDSAAASGAVEDGASEVVEAVREQEQHRRHATTDCVSKPINPFQRLLTIRCDYPGLMVGHIRFLFTTVY